MLGSITPLPLNEVIRIFFLATVSFVLAFIFAPFLLRFLKHHKLGKQIRDGLAAPIFAALHKNKSGTPIRPGKNVGIGKDDTIFAKANGLVQFKKRKIVRFDSGRKWSTYVSIVPKA